jgi:uracil-DNA glycosylase
MRVVPSVQKSRLRPAFANLETETRPLVEQCDVCRGSTEERVSVGMGDITSPILILNGSPNLVDAVKNKSMGGNHLEFFTEGLRQVGLNMEKHTYMIPIVRCIIPKITKVTARNCDAFCSPFVTQPHVRLIIGLGFDVAKWSVSRGGATPNFDVVAGKALTHPLYPKKRLFFLYHPSEIFEARSSDEVLDDMKKQKQTFVKLREYLLTQADLMEWLDARKATVRSSKVVI